MGFRGDVLAAARAERKMPLTHLARAIGVHKAQVQRYEHGKQTPSPSKIRELSSVLEIPVGELFHADSTPPSLADLRVLAGMNQRELAERAGLGEDSVRRVELGQQPATVEMVSALAAALAVKADTVVKALPREVKRRQR